MAAQNDLIALVRDKQAQIAKLQAELDEVRQLLTGKQQEAAPEQSTNRRPMARRDLGESVGVPRRRKRGRKRQAKSSVTMAVDVAREAGHPLHVDVMIDRILQKHGQKVTKQTLVSSLARLVKAGEMFVRTAPNTFGLRGMEGKKAS